MLPMNFGVYATALGMGGVFATLSLIAFLMWIMGRVFGEQVTERIKEKIKKQELKTSFTEAELVALVAAIKQYESKKVPEMRTSTSWRNAGKIEGLRWYK
jgi:sodium pump decarboxylase gamma subunit